MAKTEREKMLANELYLATDSELKAMHLKAQQVLYAFNNTRPEQIAQRRELIQTLFGSVGTNPEVQPNFRCDYGCHIVAKDDLYINVDCVILDCNYVYLGSRVLMAPHVQIYTAYHPLDPIERQTGRELAASVTIGDDVWLGGGAIVCPGVTIGDGTTIGAGSVVTKDIPPGVLAVGNPCRVIRDLKPQPAEI